jgi:CRISPR-associated protein Cmr2
VSEQARFMLVFTLGPVQPFIAQARKTRDFWTGSLLLSKLMEAAMRGIEEEGGDFIFPRTRMVDDIPDIPNKYIAVFTDLSQAQAAVQKSQDQVKNGWQAVCNRVWKDIVDPWGDEVTKGIWHRQTGVDPKTGLADLKSFFEIYWVIVDREENQRYEQYGDWFAAAEERLAARKRLRDFRASEEPGEKSAISGEREVLHWKDAGKVRQFWAAIARRNSPKDIDQEGKEHLDAIDTVKRFAMKVGALPETPFPSTSSIATASFIEALLEAKIEESVLKKWEKATSHEKLRNSTSRADRERIPYLARKSQDPRYAERQWLLRNDGDLYFAETFVPRRLKEDYGIPEDQTKSLIEDGNAALRALLQATDAKISRPTPYYAVIQMDGDNMGILLSGVNSEAEHTGLSNALSTFSRETVVDLVQKQYPARLVYAGGDDVLAFAPLARDTMEAGQPRHVFDLVERLQKGYQETVKEALPPVRNQEDEARAKNVSASVGVVIAHHYTSLSYVLRSAREAEAIAKKRYGRNALVVTLIRRSGEQTRVGCHWHYDGLDEAGQPIALFSRFYQLFKNGVLSPKCIYTLLEEAPALVDMGREGPTDAGGSSSAIQSEIKRVLKRQRDPTKSDAFPDEEVNTYAGSLARLAAAMDADKDPGLDTGELPAVDLNADKRRYGLVEVLGWLLMMVFLARKEQE